MGSVLWLQRRFSETLWRVTRTIPTIRFRGNEPNDGREWISAAYRELDAPVSLDGWAQTYWRQDHNDALSQIFANEFGGSLVVSFEMSPLMQSLLDRLGIPWLDIGISPIRFLPDYAVSFRTSSHFSGFDAAAHDLRESEILAAAAHIRSAFARPEDCEDGGTIFFCQTSNDRTLIKENDFFGPERAADALEERGVRGPFLVKPHPWEPANPIVGHLIQRFGGVRADGPTYSYLASSADIDVATISSSVGQEARWFGRSSVIMNEDVQEWANSGFATMKSYLSSSFWTDLLSPVFDVRTEAYELPWRPNLLRSDLGAQGLDISIWE